MTDLQSTALQKALGLLAAAGARFCVIDADGARHGTIEPAPEREPRTVRARRWNHIARHGYVAKLAAAKVGDEIEFACDSKEEATSLASTISAHMGPGGSMTRTGMLPDGRFFARCLVVVPTTPAGEAQLGLTA